MRIALFSSLALALMLTVSGCGDNLDTATKEEIKLLDKKAAVLEKVNDKESAEKARDELEAINQKLKDLKERMAKLAKDQKPEKVLGDTLKHEEAVKKAKDRLRQARKKALENKDAATGLKGINLD